MRQRSDCAVPTTLSAVVFKPLYSVTHSPALHSPVPSPLRSVPKERVGLFSSGNERRMAEQRAKCSRDSLVSLPLHLLCSVCAELGPSWSLQGRRAWGLTPSPTEAGPRSLCPPALSSLHRNL